ncbi:bifunctional diaminohydroxyphosphoribosylaminopyrimidine deaminase/5-amino-6-(5-phosphoribosylamino)uracil reductase RibD [Coraliomargarita sp. SDUM461003]|uniref:Riboflavin biosynthesis protein RibD n=1 Tax=Thalassobacterium maritimum TaxID=3041265 RepID=A0ABU1AVM4_9BACT|nr:bifunctional diaminohydroxyphosphoribosylaminopyrimidine deaminase/5-amino-6-(5-phosphoribosylamino)uracil reductase RibD [Coraliomargarita sp. SDUM461003]MDQ8208201.1 bifunctional diaminohydroxyphosphoribosylaminopyrimidine deaminase/5-amino-6-(5-phosphoribosylamino)uracil reductase RibD [Coraliomargarita sp. SDUM461003]
MSDPLKDERFMRRALELAQRAWGQTHPNPMVGAVIVEDGEIVAEGWHHAAGKAHAEIEAIRALGRKPTGGATIYVTLEPCSTCGRTGACTDAIIAAGFAAVVVGAQDPNPAHAGRGLAILREAGIAVTSGVLAQECADLNLIFNHWITQNTPLIAAKMALTLDGKFAAASGHSRWVTGELARADVMRWRRYFPAIAVGANTVLHDNPSLTSRIGEQVWCPQRFVFDRSLKTLEPAQLPQIYSDAYASNTVLLCAESAATELQARAARHDIEVWILPEVEGQLDWQAFRARCLEAEIYGVYVEVGPRLATRVIESALVDYLFIYQAPKLLADAAAPGLGSLRNTQHMHQAWTLQALRRAQFGEDHLTRGFLQK